MKQEDPATHGAAPAHLGSSDVGMTSVSQEITIVTEIMTVEMGAMKLITNVMCSSAPLVKLNSTRVQSWGNTRERGRGRAGATGSKQTD